MTKTKISKTTAASTTKNAKAIAALEKAKPKTMFTQKELQAVKPGTWIVFEESKNGKVLQQPVILLERIKSKKEGVFFWNPQDRKVAIGNHAGKEGSASYKEIKVVGLLACEVEVPILTPEFIEANRQTGRFLTAEVKEESVPVDEQVKLVPETPVDFTPGWPFKDATLDNAPGAKVGKPKKLLSKKDGEALKKAMKKTAAKAEAKLKKEAKKSETKKAAKKAVKKGK